MALRKLKHKPSSSEAGRKPALFESETSATSYYVRGEFAGFIRRLAD